MHKRKINHPMYIVRIGFSTPFRSDWGGWGTLGTGAAVF